MVYFEDGKPLKSNYKKFKAIDVHQNDDFATMKETVFRRYKRLKDENGKLPDLIVIDGGKGQLSAAMESINELGIADKIVVIGLAKRLEEIFFPNESESILLPRTSSSLRLLQQVRDEAHRFAITFHRKLRDKRTLSTELTKIEGVGIKTAMKLLEKFGSVNEIKNKTDDELLEIVNIKIIKKIRDYFDLKV